MWFAPIEKKNTGTNTHTNANCAHDFAKSRIIFIVVIVYFQVSPFNGRPEDQLTGQVNVYNLHYGNKFNFFFGQPSKI